ncbi:conserved hypothetical protein [Perkinsus marinus ATCC 50983]|uniref:NlpC/P60 domain-containing protein n=1 Tax=Perkinsus marinus (strain ATCC 50983 / TXsc) TaxID=423536 RepID=C5KTY1_PERM5|nr:conserved hypothetical protein [Perkinsus marinus ATCC 50983]EER12023.1 conserved hypothetical protein [Perkinsus marinus ATCC 50983]|eukprot:XP_002780228.1 conserved hypothetical protein [Perkinsus marinus ATCC 50983]
MKIATWTIVSFLCVVPTAARLLRDNMDPANSALFTSKAMEEALAAPSPEAVSMTGGGDSPVTDWIDEFIDSLKSFASNKLLSVASRIIDTLGDTIDGEDMYFNFIPKHVATLKTDGQWHHYTGRCFRNIKVRASLQSDGTCIIEADYRNAISWTCAEYVLYGNVDDFHMQYKIIRGTETYKWTANHDKVHVFDLSTSLSNAAQGVIKTADFLLGRDVEEFLKHFNHLQFEKRAEPGAVDIKEEDIHPGDVVMVTNLQGQSAAIMWGGGSIPSHTLMFLRDPETQKLHAVESWAGGVRKLPFEEYLKDDAGWYNNAVLVPLKEELRDSFDNDAAWKKFVTEFEGNDYGFGNFLFTVVDTLKDNYPCLPMDGYQTCLSWEFVEVAVGLVERVKPDMAQLIFGQALNHRLGTEGLSLSEVVKTADAKLEGGAAILPTIPENDDWTYDTHRNGQAVKGPSRVCSALVCEMLRAGGALGNHELSCSEFTPWDVYSMNIFTTPTYQLKGDYAIDLTQPEALRLGYKPVTDNMAQKCESIITANSYYERANGC